MSRITLINGGTMAKNKRNAPCLCGSGKKFKKCCMNTDKAPGQETGIPLTYSFAELDDLSNEALDLIDAGKLEDAEVLAQKLLTGYPEVSDGLEKMAMIREAQGRNKEATDYYRKAVKVMRVQGADEELIQDTLAHAESLSPETS